MKKIVLALTVALAVASFAGCSQKTAEKTTPAPTQTTAPADKPEEVSSASIVNENAAFEKAISKDGVWIICTTADLTFDKELVVDGDFKNGKKDKETGAELFQRKVALYTQDKNKKVTARFSLTAPKITFNSSFGSLEHGTFKGDVYVSGKNFKLVNQKIEGNLYFLNEEAQKTFVIKDKEGNPATTITGKQELVK
jgi:predicted small lipoprotein YifL